ncbi:MAG: hypothetical protein AAB601_00965, partial [Patescibacteria group bacterium]
TALEWARESVDEAERDIEALEEIPAQVRKRSRLALAIGSIVAFLTTPPGTRSQEKGDTIEVKRTYTGLLYAGTYDRDGVLTHDASVRGGVEVLVPTASWGTATLRAVYRSNGSAAGHFFLTVPIKGETEFRVGHMPRSVSTQKPHPVSAGGHFEPPAKQAIPGAAGGVGLKFGGGTVGVYYNQTRNAVEWNAGAATRVGDISAEVAGYLHRYTWGGAVTVSAPVGTFMLFNEHAVTAAGFLEIKTPLGAPYFTEVWDYQKKKHNLEIGVTQGFSTSSFPVLLGFGYKPIEKLFSVYLVHN